MKAKTLVTALEIALNTPVNVSGKLETLSLIAVTILSNTSPQVVAPPVTSLKKLVKETNTSFTFPDRLGNKFSTTSEIVLLTLDQILRKSFGLKFSKASLISPSFPTIASFMPMNTFIKNSGIVSDFSTIGSKNAFIPDIAEAIPF